MHVASYMLIFKKLQKKTKNTKENIDECVYFCDMKDILNIV